MRPDAPELAGNTTPATPLKRPTAPPGEFADSGGVDVASIALTEGEVLHIGVPMFEAVGLVLESHVSEYIEIPLHKLPDVIRALNMAATLASIDVTDPRTYAHGRSVQIVRGVFE